MALTKEERQAAIDALEQILGVNGGDNQPKVPKEFEDAWNAVMKKYGGKNFDKISVEDLIKLLTDLYNGNFVLE